MNKHTFVSNFRKLHYCFLEQKLIQTILSQNHVIFVREQLSDYNRSIHKPRKHKSVHVNVALLHLPYCNSGI